MNIYKVLFIDENENVSKISYSDTTYFFQYTPPKIYNMYVYAEDRKRAYLKFYNRWPRYYKVMSITEANIIDLMNGSFYDL